MSSTTTISHTAAEFSNSSVAIQAKWEVQTFYRKGFHHIQYLVQTGTLSINKRLLTGYLLGGVLFS